MGSGLPGFNISEQYKCLWIAPSRTASRNTSKVLRHFGFEMNGKPVYFNNTYNYSHFIPDLNSFSDYKIICNARNPYSRVYSHFENYATKLREKNKENFRTYVETKGWEEVNLVQPILKKTLDYILRMEHIKEDLSKIPFISDKIHENQLDTYLSQEKKVSPWERFYDEDLKEIVYQTFKNHFIFWGYQK